MFIYLVTNNVHFYQVNMLMFYSVQTTDSIMVGKKMKCTVDRYSKCILLNSKSH